MQTLDAINRHIQTAQDLQSIVKTMKAIAAVSIRQYDQAVISLVEYRKTLAQGLQIMLINFPEELALLKPPQTQRLGVVVFGSDQGMCGRFNEQLVSYVQQRLAQESYVSLEPLILSIGTRMENILGDGGFAIEDCFAVPGSIEGIPERVQALVLYLDAWRREQQVEQILLFYNRPQGTGGSYAPHLRHLFPLDFSRMTSLRQRPWPSRCRPQVTLEPQQLLSALFRQHFFVGLYQACAESLASENASRLVAMQLAEKNIEERLDLLQSIYQQQRQSQITEELLDIISGFEALGNRA